MKRPFRHKHMLGIEGLTAQDVTKVLDTANAFWEVSRRPVRKVPTLRGKTVVNMFFEASTRTRTSFELAGKRLSADVVNVSASTSSITKGESLLDTCKTLGAMRPDVLVMRHGASGASHYVASKMGCSVINAGDGAHEHPTQALLDAFTIRRLRGRLDGLAIAICGDVAHSRVARSNIALLRLFGADIRAVGPRTLLPEGLDSFGVRVYDRVEPAFEGADVVMVLRVQQERIAGSLLPTLREYSRTFGIGPKQLAYAKPDALVLHPGPINRGIEIDPTIADGERSAILDQVEAGVAIRMAVLYLLAGDSNENEPSTTS